MLIAATSLDANIDRDLPPLLSRNPGVLVMCPRPLLLSYINIQAKAIIQTLHHLECGAIRTGLPNVIMAFCLDLLEALDDRRETDLTSPFQLDREIHVAGLSLILRGLGIPPSSEVDQCRICILMEQDDLNGRLSL